MSINRVIICGNLTRDPEVRTTAAGNQIMQFSMAVNDRRRDPQTGEWGDYPNYIDCTMFGTKDGKQIDFFQRNLMKGTKVTVDGALRWSQWEAKDGNGKRTKLEVIANNIEMAQAPQSQQAPQQAYQPAYTAPQQAAPVPQVAYRPAPQPAYQQTPAPAYQQGSFQSVYDEDIPF